jgi:hypothetical protein
MLVGEGPTEKVDGRRSPEEGQREEASRRRSRTKVSDEGPMIIPFEGSVEKAP